MPFTFDTVVGLLGLGIAIKEEVVAVLSKNVDLESIIVDSIEENFNKKRNLIEQHCAEGQTGFDKDLFKKSLHETDLPITSLDDLIKTIFPLLSKAIWTPSRPDKSPELNRIIMSIVQETFDGFIGKVKNISHIANEILLMLSYDTNKEVKDVRDTVESTSSKIEEIKGILEKINQSKVRVSKNILDRIERTDGGMANNGRRFSKFLKCNKEEEFEETLEDLEDLYKNLGRLTVDSRRFLIAIIERASTPQFMGIREVCEVNAHELLQYLKIDEVKFGKEFQVLEHRRFVYNPEDNVNICLLPQNDNYHILHFLKIFCAKEKFDLRKIIVDLNFTVLDE
jgi:hypothetical protein